MTDPFWQAKISAPRQRWIAQRDRLNSCLDEAADAPVAWVSGPAGSGKTTLATDYARRFGSRSLWYQLDSGDEDPTRFFAVMREAVLRSLPTQDIALPELTSAVIPAADQFARQFFAQVAQCLTAPSLIVFDDYHELPEAAPLHRLLSGVVAALPPGVRLLVLSRADPPTAFVRLRASGQLTLLCWDALRLTPGETAEITALRLGNGEEDLAVKLHALCDGWAAGLVLMCEQARQGGGDLATDDVRAGGLVFDYFAREILDRIDAQDRRFLLESSLSPYLTTAIASRLSPCGRGASVLERLQRRNNFIFNHSAKRHVYRFHPLFRDFLRRRIEQEVDASTLVDLRRKIAAILMEQGEFDDAVRLLLDAGDWARAESVLMASASDYVAADRVVSLSNRIGSFPEQWRDRSAWLLYWLAVSTLPADPGRASGIFERAYQLFAAVDDASGGILSCAGIVDGAQLAFADCRRIDPWLNRLHAAFEDAPGRLDPSVEARACYALFVGALSGTEARPELDEWAARAHRNALRGSTIDLRMQTAYASISYYLWMGEPRHARLILDEMQSWSQRQNAPSIVVLTTLAAQAMVQWLTGQFDDALTTVAAGAVLAEESGVWVWNTMLGGHGLAAALSRGDLALVHQLISSLGAGREQARPLDLAYFHFLVSWGARLENRLEEAAVHDARAHEIGAQALPLVAQGVLHFNRAQIMTALDRPAEAQGPLDALEAIARRTNSHLLRVMAGIGRALVELRTGDGACDLDALRRTLVLARRQGLVNFFGWCAVDMSRIAEIALRHRIETDFVCHLVRSRGLRPLSSSMAFETWPWRLRVRTLGPVSLLRDGQPIDHQGKAQRKPLELLYALLAHGGQAVSREGLSAELWPDAPAISARRSFDTTLHRLRKLLDVDGVLSLNEGRLSLTDHLAWVDIRVLESLMADTMEWMDAHAQCMDVSALTEHLERVGDLYPEPFLADTCDELWVLARREDLQQRLLRLLRAAAQHLEAAAAWREATDCYRKAIKVEPLAEEFHQRLISVLYRQGFKAEALVAYERCRAEMSEALGVDPSAQTLALQRRILSDASS